MLTLVFFYKLRYCHYAGGMMDLFLAPAILLPYSWNFTFCGLFGEVIFSVAVLLARAWYTRLNWCITSLSFLVFRCRTKGSCERQRLLHVSYAEPRWSNACLDGMVSPKHALGSNIYLGWESFRWRVSLQMLFNSCALMNSCWMFWFCCTSAGLRYPNLKPYTWW